METRPASPTPPFIVLKLDDMVAQDGLFPARWKRVITFSLQRDLKISIGLIGKSLVDGLPPYIEDLKSLAAGGLVELWHHGYDHARWQDNGATLSEFQHTPRAHQQDHFDRTRALAREKLGLTFTAFGAPFNAIDITTADVLATDPSIRVWLYGDEQNPAGKFIARRVPATDLEVPVHKPNYAAFTAGYAAERAHAHRYLVLQGHPLSWDDAAFSEFERVIDFLQADGCRFIHPSELPTLIARPCP